MVKDFLKEHNFEETEFVWRKEFKDVFLKLDKGNNHWYFDGKLIDFPKAKFIVENNEEV